MKRIVLALIAALSLGSCAVSSQESSHEAVSQTTQSAVKTVSAEEAQKIMEEESAYIIVDVRTPEEYASGHVPGAICIPVETMDSKPEELADEDQLIMLYCRSGNRSAQAASKLEALGYQNIVDFGGITSWTGEIVTD